MSAYAPCPLDHPLMIAWNAYKATEDYPNTKKWAVYPEHVEGSLWAAFMAGFNSQSVAISEGNAEREAMLDNLNAAYEEKRAKEAYAVSLRAAAERMVQTYRDWMAGCDNGAKTKDVEAAHINLRDALNLENEICLPCPDAERMGEYACKNKAQCWEPCGELGKSEAHVRVASPEASAAVDAALRSHAVVPQLGPIWMPSAPLIEKLASLRERVDAVEPADHAGADDLERIVADLRAIEAELRECHSQCHAEEPKR